MILFKKIEQSPVCFIKKIFFIVVILLFFFSCNSNENVEEKETNITSPNFILILADDQGWNGTSVKMMHNEPTTTTPSAI